MFFYYLKIEKTGSSKAPAREDTAQKGDAERATEKTSELVASSLSQARRVKDEPPR